MSPAKKNNSLHGPSSFTHARLVNMLRPMVGEIREVLLKTLEFLVARQHAEYPFVDTKFHPITGEDFAENDVLRGRNVIYTWIQGRALEALAEHERHLASINGGESLRDVIRQILKRVSDQMETLRAGKHLPFFMTSQGEPLALDESGLPIKGSFPNEANFADLFYSKGLAAAAKCLGDENKFRIAETLFDSVIQALRESSFQSGQISFDIKNPVGKEPGRHSQGPWMIAIGGATTFWRYSKNPRYAKLGRKLITYVLSRHAQMEEGRFLPGDFWEFIDDSGNPWEKDGKVWSDPGHATEFTGLALAHLKTTPKKNDHVLKSVLRQILRRNFQNGFTGRGLVKAFDLVQRIPINTDQPWWSLPETMRAAALSLEHAEETERDDFFQILADCWNAFRNHYLRPEVGYHAIQCLDEHGHVSTTIPATPDLDPAYHTGLSLLAVLEVSASLETQEVS